MVSNIRPSSFVTKSAYLVIAVVATVGLWTVDGSGVMWDEDLHAAVPHFTLGLVRDGTPLPFDIQYYGPFVDLSSNILFRAVKPFLKEEPIANPERLKIRAVLPATSIVVNTAFYHFKHGYVFLISLFAYVSVAALVGIIAGPRYGYLGALALALTPRFWGHSYFNPKDAPFASFFTASTLLGALLIGTLLTSRERYRFGKNGPTFLAIGFGMMAGITTAVRVGGGVLLPFLVLSLVSVGALDRELKTPRFVVSTAKVLLWVCLSWSATVYLCHPAAWKDPITWLLEAIAYLSHHPFEGWLLFKGAYISNQKDLPWSYIPLWFAITTPLILQLLFFGGLLACAWRFRRSNAYQQAAIVMVLLQGGFLLGWAILNRSPLDTGIRQFLFILPSVAVLAASAYAMLASKLSSRPLAKAALHGVTLVWAALVVWDMVILHPYQYVYFNQIARSLYHHPEEKKPLYAMFETDSLGLSLREATEWLNANANRSHIIYMNGPLHSVLPFADEDLSILHLAHVKQESVKPPFYYLSLPRGNWDNWYSKCKTMFRAQRQLGKVTIPLSVVKYCEK